MTACQRHLLTCSVTALVQPDGMGMQLPSLSREEFMPLINTVSHFGHLRSQVPLFTWPTTSLCAARQQMSFWLPSTVSKLLKSRRGNSPALGEKVGTSFG